MKEKWPVLVVDDEENVRESLSVILNDDYEVLTAASGQEALSKIEQQRPGMLFLDIRMPEMDGLETLRRIREKDQSLDVVIVTAVDNPVTPVESRRLGISGYIVKPFEEKEIKGTVARVFAKKREEMKKHQLPPFSGSSEETLRLHERIRELEAELQQIRRLLLHTTKLSTLGEIAAGTAHEIKNPLTSILTLAHILRLNPSLDATAKNYLERIQHEVHRTVKILDRVLHFSRPSQTEHQLINVNTVLQEALLLLSPQLRRASITLEEHYASSLPAILGDAGQLEQVFMNIILNAIQAIRSRGTITITTQLIALGREPEAPVGHSKKRVQIQFKDTGCGIRPENLSKIFDPFFSTKDSQKGAGLGLAICQDIIRLHHGTITVESTFGKGATFTILLPVPVQDT